MCGEHEICQNLDGEVFKVEERETGVNFPPMHPYCRSSFEIVVPEDYEARYRRRYEKRTENAIMDEVVLQNRFDYLDCGEALFIPKGTRFETTKTIAGFGTNSKLRVADQLAHAYGGRPKDWAKCVGKIESKLYIFDIHWYEREEENVQREMKLKYRKEKRR